MTEKRTGKMRTPLRVHGEKKSTYFESAGGQVSGQVGLSDCCGGYRRVFRGRKSCLCVPSVSGRLARLGVAGVAGVA